MIGMEASGQASAVQDCLLHPPRCSPTNQTSSRSLLQTSLRMLNSTGGTLIFMTRSRLPIRVYRSRAQMLPGEPIHQAKDLRGSAAKVVSVCISRTRKGGVKGTPGSSKQRTIRQRVQVVGNLTFQLRPHSMLVTPLTLPPRPVPSAFSNLGRT